ncbi:hypothetical protein YC2023_115233 [Brassica napus]
MDGTHRPEHSPTPSPRFVRISPISRLTLRHNRDSPHHQPTSHSTPNHQSILSSYLHDGLPQRRPWMELIDRSTHRLHLLDSSSGVIFNRHYKGKLKNSSPDLDYDGGNVCRRRKTGLT